MPTKTFAAADTPTAPPTPRVRSSSHENPRTTIGSTRQWNSSADRALTTSTSGSARKARTKLVPGTALREGRGAPPR